MKRHNESGVALLSAILVLMLMSALLVGFIAMVNADQLASGVNRDQTQAYSGAHAAVEKLTSDLGRLFETNFSPTGVQVAALTTAAMEPVLPGITFQRPNGTSGYRITFIDDFDAGGNPGADGMPDLEVATGSPITAGPYEGLVGLITPYTMEITARTAGNAETRMRRTLQTVAIPVFQFGIFSENNQSFFAGPDFGFGGRVHTNQNLFLKQDNGATLTLQDRVTAVGEIIRTHLSNGQTTHHGTVRMALASGCPAAPAATNGSCRDLEEDEGSKVGDPTSVDNPDWIDISTGDYGSWIRDGTTGAKRLDLPIVSDGAAPIDIIKRPATAAELPTSAIGRQRFYNMATLRILISDRPQDMTALPGVVWTAAGVNQSPVRLAGTYTPPTPGINNPLDAGVNSNLHNAAHPFSTSDGDVDKGARTSNGTANIDGWILINRQDRTGAWTDVTRDVLSLGFSGRRLSSNQPNAGVYTANLDAADLTNGCPEPHPNAVIRLQRIRDTFNGSSAPPGGPLGRNGCGAHALALNQPSLTSSDYWPNVLYDAREGMLRDDENARPTAAVAIANVVAGQQRMYWGGVMHYAELDVRNLRRWLRGDIGNTPNNAVACAAGAGPAQCPMDTTGFVVYFSDRRGNRDLGLDNVPDLLAFDANGPIFTDDAETGEFGFEDNINTTATSAPNAALDHLFVDAQGINRWSEDVNQNGTLQNYGQFARLVIGVAGTMQAVPLNYSPALGVYDLFTIPIDRNVARNNRAFFFRRALKLVNGGRGNLPANGTQGLTLASENPVYIQGNFNACTNAVPTAANTFSPACAGGVGFGAVPGVDHVSASVIADSITFLSNAWNDVRSFVNPHDVGITGTATLNAQNQPNARQARPTWYRVAIIAGKGLSFPRAAVAPTGRDHTDFGTDGGAHNFIRYVENWGGVALNYRGSLISFYTSRQAVGIYKCCSIVYGAPTRGYNFDQEFLTPALLPPRTPMFRDINTLTFRQILRPTQ